MFSPGEGAAPPCGHTVVKIPKVVIKVVTIPDPPPSHTLQILPMENVGGRDLVEGGKLCERKNGRGVDPNRNWEVGARAGVGAGRQAL